MRLRARAPFVAAHGWGTFAQQRSPGQQTTSLRLAYGQLSLRSLRLAVPGPVADCRVTVDGQPVAASLTQPEGAARLDFTEALNLSAGQTLSVSLSSAVTDGRPTFKLE